MGDRLSVYGYSYDTSRFSRSDAGIEAAGSKLLAMGADHRYVMRTMQDKTLDDLIRQGEILRRVKRVMEGKVAYVYSLSGSEETAYQL